MCFQHSLLILNLIASVISFDVKFEPNKTTLNAGSHQSVKIILWNLPEEVVKSLSNGENQFIEIKSNDEALVDVKNDENSKWIEDRQNQIWSSNFSVNGVFLGNYRVPAA